MADGSSEPFSPENAAPTRACWVETIGARSSFAPTPAAARRWRKSATAVSSSCVSTFPVPGCLEGGDQLNKEQSEDFGVKGKVAIVTGGGAAATGIGNGRAAAILLAKAGAKVAVVDRQLELAEATVKMIAGEGGEGIALAADVTRGEDCAALVAAVLDRFGRIDRLDNNVGIGGRGSVVEESQENWRRIM